MTKKANLIIDSGRLAKHYRSQTNPQPIVCDIEEDGKVYIFANPEIGNAVPQSVWHGITRRLTLNGIQTKVAARAWFRAHKAEIQTVINGMDDEWDGNNKVGTLTEEAREALDSLEYACYSGR
jgi:hypothetical protein